MAEADNNNMMNTFDMGALRSNLPTSKRGLSRYYSGKSRSFTCMADVQCLEDLKKPEHIPDAKKRKKYSERNKATDHHIILPLPPYPTYCRTVPANNQCSSPCHVGV
ncbi:protein OXIDATIVE STRESS 3 LIKE 3-like [Humulus lupulus]|uniref:protein OXIDATIVE STRESS 3 LIKE 3-like n=1 Tax=Humulus lupulus TaxID=3486 RepID=UPI002B40619D|nr:protein OXIDATIVE STRESS 3 LIKE 3-like [Humulus lupulus]